MGFSSRTRTPELVATHATFGTYGDLFTAPTRSMSDALGWPVDCGTHMVSNYSKHVPGFTRAADRGRTTREIYEPALTITSKAFRWKTGEHVRTCTVPEVAALQGFPEDYPWQGGVSAQRQQVGNAVPVELASALVRAVI